MSSASAELQAMINTTLRADAAVVALIGDRVFKKVPANSAFPYISFGPHDIVEDGADCIESGEHTLQLDVWSRSDSQVEAKLIVDAVKRCLHEAEAELADNALVEMTVGFRQVFSDPDGITTHGVVRVTALIEEND
jgi:hypothetical protein